MSFLLLSLLVCYPHNSRAASSSSLAAYLENQVLDLLPADCVTITVGNDVRLGDAGQAIQMSNAKMLGDVSWIDLLSNGVKCSVLIVQGITKEELEGVFAGLKRARLRRVLFVEAGAGEVQLLYDTDNLDYPPVTAVKLMSKISVSLTGLKCFQTQLLNLNVPVKSVRKVDTAKEVRISMSKIALEILTGTL